MSSSLKANEAVSPERMSSRFFPAKWRSMRPEMISVCTGTLFSVCSVPVAVTTISSNAMFLIASPERRVVVSCAVATCVTQSKATEMTMYARFIP